MASFASVMILGAAVAYLLLCIYQPETVALSDSLTLNICIVLVYAAILLGLWSVLIKPRYFSPLRHLPGPKGGSLWHGQLWRLLREPSGAPQREWMAIIPNNGLIRYLSLFNQEKVLLTESSTLSEVLVTKTYDFSKPAHIRKDMMRTIGNGLLLAEGEDHKYQRKHLQPAFKHRQIKDLYPTFVTYACRMVENIAADIISNACNSGVEDDGYTLIPLRAKIHGTLMDTIGKAGADAQLGALDDSKAEINQLYGKVLSGGTVRYLLNVLCTVLPASFCYSLPLKQNKALNDAGSDFRILARQVVRRRKERKTKDPGNDPHDILGAIIDGQAFTDEGLEDQVMNMIAAGLDVTSVAVSWGLLTLCQHPEIATRLREEIRQNLPSPGNAEEMKAITSDMVDALPYLNAFCNEVNRFFPGVPMTTRVSIRDTVIGGQAIPRGTTLVISPAAINKDERFWGSDAGQFNPERFMKPGQANSGGASIHFANLSFLQGPHSCIGEKFARSELACLMAVIVGRFEMKLGPSGKLPKARRGVNPIPEGELELRLRAMPGW